MKSLNDSTEKKEKQTKAAKPINNDSKGWFSTLKKSFVNRKNKNNSTNERSRQYISEKSEIPGKSDTQNGNNSVNNGNFINLSNFSNDFLDSFIQKNSSSFYNDTLKSKLKNYHNKNANNLKPQLNNLIGFLFNGEQPKNMEQILMTVVEEYINSTCEKMLHDKMKSVHRKIQNWTKSSLTRPGFKNHDPIPGGNITKPEKSFVIDKNSKYNKWERKYPNSQIQEKCLISRHNKQVFDDYKFSASVSNSICETVKEVKSTKKYTPSSDFINGKTNSDKYYNKNMMNIHSVKVTEKNIKMSSIRANNAHCSANETKKNFASAKSTSNDKQNYKNVLMSEFTDSSAKLEHIYKKSLNEFVNCKCMTEVNNEPGDSEMNDKNSFSHNKLNICDAVNIDIKPSLERQSPKLFSRIPKFHSSLKSEKSSAVSSLIEDHPKSDHFEPETKMKSLNHIIKPKIRRSVTFLEPRQNILKSFVFKDSEFRSNWEIKSEVSKSEINNTSKSIKFSNLSIPDLSDTRANLYSPSIYSSKNEFSTNLLRSVTLNEISKFNETDDCTTIKNDQKQNSFSPVIISLQSTPSFVGDINYPYTSQISPDNSATQFSTSKRSAQDKLNSISETNNSLFYSDNVLNMLNIESTWNINSNEFHKYKPKSMSNSKNYSVIEIINKTTLGANETPKDPLALKNKFTNRVKTKSSKKLESVNSSTDSNITDEDVLISTGSIKSKTTNQPLLNLQEIDLSEDGDNSCHESKVLILTKTPFSLSQMKTANFSSIGKESPKPQEDSILQAMNNSYLSLACNKSNSSKKFCKSFNETLTAQTDSNNSKNMNLLEHSLVKKEKNRNVLRHTVASKQKMRDKVNFKSRTERQPMKFSKGLSRIY